MISQFRSVLLLMLCLCSPQILEAGKKVKTEYYLSAATIFQNEARFLKEWIEYHKLQGVEHFYFYNNLSTDDYMSVLKPYIQKGEVELIQWNKSFTGVDEWTLIQCSSILDALSRSRKTSEWLAILDTDEFVVPVGWNSVAAMLKAHEGKKHNGKMIAGIGVHWIGFGTSDVEQVPDDKLMIELLTRNGGANSGSLYKTIVKPRCVTEVPSSHACHYLSKYTAKHIGYSQAHINHYWSRDQKFLHEVKIPRRLKIGYSKETCLSWSQASNGQENEYSRHILRFIPQLKQRMGLPD